MADEQEYGNDEPAEEPKQDYAEQPPVESNIQQEQQNYTEKNKEAEKGDDYKKPEVKDGLYDNDGDGEHDEELFEGSTHNFAIYYGQKKDINGCIVAAFIMVLQIVIYIVCMSQVVGDLTGDDFTIPVNVRYGKECNGTSAALICPPDVPDLGYVALAAILLSMFLMHDILASVRAWITIPGCWSKLAGGVLLFEAIFAALIGTLFAVAATSGYDAIANCIGVLFIHDIDEKAYEAFMIIQADRLKQKKCCGPKCIQYARTAIIFISTFAIMCLALIIAAAIRGAQVAQIQDIYGDSYYSDNFGSSGYSYSWDTSSWWGTR